MADHPKDRFDEVPDDLKRVGSHRAPDRKGRAWFGLAWAALATATLTIAGLITVAAINDNINFEIPIFGGESSASPSETAPPEPTVEPRLDPEVAVTVLNGTPVTGLATNVGDDLVEMGWNGAALGTGTRANASSNDIEETVVYYNSSEHEAAAKAMVESLGVGEIRFTEEFSSSPIVVVLGLDYASPQPSGSPTPASTPTP